MCMGMMWLWHNVGINESCFVWRSKIGLVCSVLASPDRAYFGVRIMQPSYSSP